jgi:hypothetical protein
MTTKQSSKNPSSEYLIYKKATANSMAKQSDIDKLAKEVKKGWWAKNRIRFIKSI